MAYPTITHYESARALGPEAVERLSAMDDRLRAADAALRSAQTDERHDHAAYGRACEELRAAGRAWEEFSF